MVKKILISIIMLILVNGISSTFAQNIISPDVEKKISSKVLNEERTYKIYLPREYDSKNSKYPLMIVLDGYFLYSSGVIDYMIFSGNVPPMIIVSIDNTDRDRDFTPTNSKNLEGEYIPSSGGAPNFLKFLKTELIPEIETNYKVENFRLIAGHSLSAFFVSYVLLESPDLFQAYFAMSPTLPWDNNFLINKLKKMKSLDNQRNLFYYLVMDQQKGEMLNSAKEFSSILKKKNFPKVYSNFKRYEDEDHISCFLVGLYYSLKDLYSNYKISEKLITSADAKGVEKHFTSITTKYGYNILPSASWIVWIANWHFLMKRYKGAIELLELAAKYHPSSEDVKSKLIEVLTSYGEVLKTDKNSPELKSVNEKIKQYSLAK